MTSEAKKILEVLPDLIRDDPGFRLRLWEVLSGDFASKADIALVLKEIDRSRQEADRRFEQIDRRLEQIDRRLEQTDRRLEQTDRRFEEMDRRFQTLVIEMREGFQTIQDWVGVVVGGFQNRAGRGLEDAVAGTLRIALRMRDVDPSKIRLRQKVVDANGIIGPAGRSYEVDILATNGESWVFEVKSTADEEDVERFNDKAELAIAVVPLPGANKALITLGRSPEVAAACHRLGIVVS